jgi:hypothetical protein
MSAIIPPERLASIEEHHTASAAHRKCRNAVPGMGTAEAIEVAAHLTEEQALDELPDCLRPPA